MTGDHTGSRTYEIVQVRPAGATAKTDLLATEVPYDLVVNGETIQRFYASPDDLRSLALGHLFLRGRLATREDLLAFEVDGNVLRAEVRPGAGRQGRQAPPQLTTSADQLWAQMEAMAAGMTLFHATGGVHGGALWDRDGQRLAQAWDVARHHVIDKLCGQVLDQGLSPRGMVLTFSGRQAAAIVEKALAMEVSVLAGVSAPSSLGVDKARAGGLTLAGFVRPGKMNLYAHPERIHGSQAKAEHRGPLRVTVTAAVSGSGKTTAILQLLDLLGDLRLGVWKSASHPYEMNDKKDTGRFVAHGADLVVYQGPDGLHIHRLGDQADADAVIDRLSRDLDILFIESRGIRQGLLVEVVRGPEGLAAYQDRPPAEILLTDQAELLGKEGVYDLNDLRAFADFLRDKVSER